VTPAAPRGVVPRSVRAATVVRPLEAAQVVWQRAVDLAGSGGDRDDFALALDLLRRADHSPSTMLHALTLGRARHRDRPEDPIVDNGVELRAPATTWLGSQPSDREVGRSG
jgi:hypothetical protein